LKDVKSGFAVAMDKEFGKAAEALVRYPVEGRKHDLGHGDVVIAAITSCTKHLEPVGHGGCGAARPQCRRQGADREAVGQDVARPAVAGGRRYLKKSGLQKDLDKLGFNLVGYGCTTCIGNSGPLPADISKTINANDVVAAAVLSGNRNFEGRVNQMFARTTLLRRRWSSPMPSPAP